jgi:hypothetical protein
MGKSFVLFFCPQLNTPRRTGDGGRRAEDGGQVGNGLTLKVFRKHIKRLVNYAEAGDGGKIREELKRIVPEYDFTTETQRTRRKDKKIM